MVIVALSGIAIARSPQNATNQPYTSIYPQLAKQSIGQQPQVQQAANKTFIT